jgi:hypothetical protein
MFRSLAIAVAVLIAMPSLAGAPATSGQKVTAQPRPKAKVRKIDALTLKQKTVESDPDRPVIRGTVPNPSAKKPSPSDRRSWKSRSGHTIPFD